VRTFREGEVEFYAPEGDATKKLHVFYNPVMALDRDLTVAVLRAHGGRSYCDALAGSGIRGMRAAKETGFKDVFFNDSSDEAVGLIKRNLKRNDIEGQVSCEDINLFLRRFRRDKFDVIDIDPFGSSIVALDSALRAIKRKNGLLCLTFTDTAPLCGVSIKTCQRRYDARPIRTSYAKEVGLRILIGACARMVAKYEFALRPLLCYNRRHYFRLFLTTENGMKKADDMLSQMSYLQHCFKCDWRGYAAVDRFEDKCPNCGAKLDWAGPLWTGVFADTQFCGNLEGSHPEIRNLARLIANEQEIATPFYDLHHFSKLRKVLCPAKNGLMAKLRETGHKAAETHFAKTGIRSDVLPDF